MSEPKQMLSEREIAKIMQYVFEQDRERRLTVGRMRYMMSYWIRRANDRDCEPFVKGVAEMARSHVGSLVREIARLREGLEAIAAADNTYNLQDFAAGWLKEPDLGPPDIVCKSNDLDDTTAHEFDGGITHE